MVVGDPKQVQLQLQGLLVGVESHFEKRENHGEDHPDVDHLHIRCRWQSARYTDEAERLVSNNQNVLDRLLTKWPRREGR